ncbi:MAG TPA: MarR family transcriptional regulator [Thermopolyspora sp.]
MRIDDPAALAGGLSRVLRHVVLVLRAATAGQPITGQQFAVLVSLEGGSRRMSELAEEQGVQLPTMTAQVNRLEKPGLVSRGVDPTDGRVRTVRLTEPGRACLADARRIRYAYLTARLAELTPAERASIAAALPALAKLGRP